MSISDAPSPPIISFAGRLTASGKGLATIADAVTVLECTPNLPRYILWLIGGSEQERAYLNGVAARHPGLGGLCREGRCVIWGHVEADAMPELYSRSTVVVLPSHYEQFGFVGIEAMACGSPLLASRVGGFLDTVVPGVTGELFPVDSPMALASALTCFLRDPERAAWQGSNALLWTKQRFALDAVYGQLYDLVTRTPDAPPPSPLSNPTEIWHEILLAQAWPVVQVLLGTLNKVCESGVRVERLERGFAAIHLAEEVVYARVVHPEPSLHRSTYPLSPAYPPRSAAEIVRKHRILQSSGLLPPVLANSDDGRVLLMGPVVGRPPPISWAEIEEAFAGLGRQLTPAGAVADYLAAARQLGEDPSPGTLEAFDYASSVLNAPLDGRHQLHRTHPHAELLRVLFHLDSGVWRIPEALAIRMRAVAELATRDQPLVLGTPTLCHGRWARDYVPGRVLPDADDAVFAAGPLHAVRGLRSDARRPDERSLPVDMETLRAGQPDRGEFLLAAQWLLAESLHAIATFAVRGDEEAAFREFRYLAGFYEGAYRTGFIQ